MSAAPTEAGRKYKTLAANTALVSLGTVGSKLMMFFMVRFYTGYMSPADYGTADIITQTANLLIPLVSLGMAEGVFRFAAMVPDKCREAFGKMGVSEIEAQGKPFDPELHAAVLQQPSTDDMPSGTVTQVMQKGYLLHDKVIRHAAVAVSE